MFVTVQCKCLQENELSYSHSLRIRLMQTIDLLLEFVIEKYIYIFLSRHNYVELFLCSYKE